LLDRLQTLGLQVRDAGDVAGEPFSVASFDTTARNVDAVTRVALAVAAAVEREARAGSFPIVLGGDCTITLGVVAGLQRVHQDVRLAYFDGDADLNSPQRTRSGILDATGVAHLLGIADTPLARIGRTTPMLAEHQLVLLGYDPSDPDSYDGAALEARPGLTHFSDAALRADPTAVARQAITALTGSGARIAVHFDVDAVDSRDLPLANFPHYGTGIPLHAVGKVLRTLLAAEGVCALVLTEVNPTHDPTGNQLDRYLDTVIDALGSAMADAP
jgi:arginase